MSWSIDEIELDSFPLHAYWSELYRDATLTLEIHLIEGLRLELALLECPCDLHETIGKSRLSMIDMGDDTEIADGRWFRHADTIEKRPEKTRKKLQIIDSPLYFSYKSLSKK